jgi:predicted anti-sigma-YlaC factor YlaD
MIKHEDIRKLLPLAVSADLSAADVKQVREHLASCAQCRATSEDFAALGQALRSLPTPQPRPELLARVRAAAESRMVNQETRTRDIAILALLVVAAWISAIASWPVVSDLGKWILAGVHVPGGRWGVVLTTYSIFGFLLSCVAAIAVGRRARAIGRIR